NRTSAYACSCLSLRLMYHGCMLLFLALNSLFSFFCCFFFFQAEDGIRDFHVTGVQTCALPIWRVLLTQPGIQLLQALGRADIPPVSAEVLTDHGTARHRLAQQRRKTRLAIGDRKSVV